MELLYALLVILVITRGFGELAERVGQPMLVGELVAGTLLGLIVGHYSGAFPVLAGLTEDEVFHALTDLGIFFVMLQAGIELRPGDLARASKGAALVAVGGMMFPLALGFGLAWVFIPQSPYWLPQAMFLGVALAITAVPVAVKVLLDIGKLDTRVGRLIVSAAILDDVLSLVLLSVLTAVIKTGGVPDLVGAGWLCAKAAVFFAVAFSIGRFALPWIARRASRLRIDELEFSFLVAVALAFGVLAELLDMHFILGAFTAGLFFVRRTINERVYTDVKNKINALSTGFLAPIFFASIGMHLDLTSLWNVPLFVLLLLACAILGKVLGAGLPALLAGATRKESAAIGLGMNARGAVELVIADIALRAGLFRQPTPIPPVIEHMFSAVVIMAILTTLLTPVILKPLLRERGKT